MVQMLELPQDSPGKLRKSNSENRRPPAPQSEYREEFGERRRRSSRRKATVLAEVNSNVGEPVAVQLEDGDLIKSEEGGLDHVKLKNVRIDLIPVQTEAITPSNYIPVNNSMSQDCRVEMEAQTDPSLHCCSNNAVIMEELSDLKTGVRNLQSMMALLLGRIPEITQNRHESSQASRISRGGEAGSSNKIERDNTAPPDRWNQKLLFSQGVAGGTILQ